MAKLTTLQDLFVKELQDVYDAERQISTTLPKMKDAAQNERIRAAFDEHENQTLEQISRLEQVFQTIDSKAKASRCQGIAGIIEEGASLFKEELEAPALDAGLIAGAQRVEHYEIAAYGTLATYARRLGHEQAAALLEQTLQEEKDTDRKLTELAESIANPAAEQHGRQGARA